MALSIFNNADESPILDALRHDCDDESVVSVQFRAKVPPVRTIDESEQWLRLRGILGCPDVYDAFGIISLGIDLPASFHYATALETIGTLANVFMRGGVHRKFVENHDEALAISKAFLDTAFLKQYGCAEAYSTRDPWCSWFVGERVLDETVLIGNLDEWWLLAVTGTD